MKICHVVTNDMMNDPRVDKIATTLSKVNEVVVLALGGHRKVDYKRRSYKVILVGRPSVTTIKKKESIKSYLRGRNTIIHRHIRDAVSYYTRKAIWKKMVVALEKIDADLYVANDLDTLGLCATVAKRKKAKLIYDSHEFYVDSGVVTTQV